MSGPIQERYSQIKNAQENARGNVLRLEEEKTRRALEKKNSNQERLLRSSSLSIEAASKAGVISVLEDVRSTYWKEGAISMESNGRGGTVALLTTNIEYFTPHYTSRVVRNVRGKFCDIHLASPMDTRPSNPRTHKRADKVEITEFSGWGSTLKAEELRFEFFAGEESLSIYSSDSVLGKNIVPDSSYYSNPEIGQKIRSKYLKKRVEKSMGNIDYYGPANDYTVDVPYGLRINLDELDSLGLEYLVAFTTNSIDRRIKTGNMPSDIRDKNQIDPTRIRKPHFKARIGREKVAVLELPESVLHHRK